MYLDKIPQQTAASELLKVNSLWGSAPAARLSLAPLGVSHQQPQRSQLPSATRWTEKKVVWLLFLYVMSHPDFVYWGLLLPFMCVGVRMEDL